MDVYKVGSVAAVKAVHDTSNPFLPYYMNMFPTHKAELTAFIDKVAPLARVQTKDLSYLPAGVETAGETNEETNGETNEESDETQAPNEAM